MSERGRLRSWLALAGVGAILVAAAVLATSVSPPVRDDGPGGTVALRRLLAGLGMRVRDGAEPPELPGTFVLLRDVRGPSDEQALLTWVEHGGRLVLADAGSEMLRLLGIQAVGRSLLSGTTTVEPGCASPEVRGVGSILAQASDPALESASGPSIPCFPRAVGAFAILVDRGKGRVVLLSGTGPLVNASLDQADNARFAVQAMGSEGTVVFGPASAPATPVGPPGSIWDLVPERARAALVVLAMAAIAFALVRGRRFGRPVVEPPISPIPGSELVRASAGLYRRARAVDFSGRMLREGMAARVGRRLGLSPWTPGEEIPAAVAAAARIADREVRQALSGPEPRTDEELLALARELEEMERRVEGATR
jgi:hypothetical protein